MRNIARKNRGQREGQTHSMEEMFVQEFEFTTSLVGSASSTQSCPISANRPSRELHPGPARVQNRKKKRVRGAFCEGVGVVVAFYGGGGVGGAFCAGTCMARDAPPLNHAVTGSTDGFGLSMKM